MNSVQPIRDLGVIENIKDDLRLMSERNYIFFCLGIYTGLRVSDLLKVRVSMVRDQTHINLVEEKTKNTKRRKVSRKFLIHPKIKDDLNKYIEGKSDNDYLFPSRQRKKKTGARNQPFDRTTAYKMLNDVARRYGLKEIGCHTMRKTFGFHTYLNTGDVALLMEMFNHSHQTITLRYLGVSQDRWDAAARTLR